VFDGPGSDRRWNLASTTSPDAEPMVRIHLPPAESLSLSRSCFQGTRTPAFRAAVRGWLGDRVGRDAQGVSRSRQPAAISLSRHIPVPQCRWGRREYHSGPDKVGAFAELDRAADLCAGPGSTKAEHDPLSVPGKRQA